MRVCIMGKIKDMCDEFESAETCEDCLFYVEEEEEALKE